MENISKALSIAGSVLIGVLVLALIVTFYNNLSSYEKTKADSLLQTQTTNFNDQFYNYQDELYGSELLSLINKVVDYNIKEADSKGYSKIEIEVTFINDYYTKIGTNKIGILKGKKSSQDIFNGMQSLLEKVDEYGKRIHHEYNISELYKMRTNELQEWYKNFNSSEKTTIDNEIKIYSDLKGNEIKFKSKKYEYINSVYDDKTGRITKLCYKEK